jgi:HEAT repeat protein
VTIQATCPKCAKSYNLRDDYEGKTVRCKDCSTSFTVTVARPVAAVTLPAVEEDDEAEAPAPPAKAQRRPGRSDEGDERPARRQTPTKKLLLIISGIYLVLALPPALIFTLAGSLFSSSGSGNSTTDKEKQFSDAMDKAFKDAGFDTSSGAPANLDELLKQVRTGDAMAQATAANKLAGLALDPARQAEVARALDKMLASPRENAQGPAMRALLIWADKDSVPAVAKVVADDASAQGFGETRKDGMKILARLKDERGAPAVAKSLANAFFNQQAIAALEEMGQPVAEKAVLAYLFHQDGGARERARKLLEAFGTAPAVIVGQAVADLQGSNNENRRNAADWLAAQPVDPAVQAQVAQALNKLFASPDNNQREVGLKAAAVWASPDNVPALLQILQADPERSDGTTSAVIKLLGKLKDPRAAAVLAERLRHGGERSILEAALVSIGPAAEPEVSKYRDSPDQGVRAEAVKILRMLGSAMAGPGSPAGGNVDLDQALIDLKSDGQRRQDAARKLATMKVEPGKRSDVAKALEAALDSAEAGTTQLVIRALAVWGNQNNSAALVKLLASPRADIRHPALEQLAVWKDPTSVPAMAARLLIPEDRGVTRKALETMGPVAEPEVVKGLKYPDKGIVIECCNILAVIGTRSSVPALNQIGVVAQQTKQNDLLVAATRAIAACRTR